MEGLLSNESSVNETRDKDTNRCREFNASARLFFLVAYILVFVVGLLLNGFVLRFYFSKPQKLSKTMMIYLKNLTAAGFLLSLCLLFYIINSTTSYMSIRLAYCKFGSKVFYLNMYASMLFMAHIALNRYLKIVLNSSTHILLSVRAVHIISTITWVVLIIIFIAYLSTMSLFKKENLTTVPISCNGFQSSKGRTPQKIANTCRSAFFLSILVFLIYVYYRTCCKVSEVQQNPLPCSNPEKLAKSRKKMMVLVGVFCVCFVPFHLVDLPYGFLGCHWSHELHFLKDLTQVFLAFNVCLDPFIYFFFCKEFREQLKLKNKLFVRMETLTSSVVTEMTES